jgi:hypothetical protein
MLLQLEFLFNIQWWTKVLIPSLSKLANFISGINTFGRFKKEECEEA